MNKFRSMMVGVARGVCLLH